MRSRQTSRAVLVDPEGEYPPGVDYRRVEPSLDALVEEDRVEDVTCCGVETERDVRKTEDRGDPWELRLDRLDPFDCLDAVAATLFHARRQRQRERVEEEITRVRGRNG